MTENWYDINSARGSIRTFIPQIHVLEKCLKGHPISPHSGCLYCLHVPEKDLKSKCYNCDKCRADREFLSETNKQFQLVFYECNEEWWQCNKCGKAIAFQPMTPGIMRDIVHIKGREIHMKYICDDIVCGNISY